MTELLACISNKDTYEGFDTRAVDGLYLGQPYCLKYKNNFLVKIGDLTAAIADLRAHGKKAYLTTPAIPKGKDLPIIKKAIAAAAEAGIDGIEANDVGVFRLLRREFPQIRVHVGNFINIYNEKSAALFGRMGAARIVPNHELTREELAVVTSVEGIEFERPVHGPLALGMAYACLLVRKGEGEELESCSKQCSSEHYLELEGWRMRSVGTALLMGTDYSLIEHLRGLEGINLSALRLETYFDGPEKINRLGGAFQRSLTAAEQGLAPTSEDICVVRDLVSGRQMCNGWHFGRSGRDYVGGNSE